MLRKIMMLSLLVFFAGVVRAQDMTPDEAAYLKKIQELNKQGGDAAKLAKAGLVPEEGDPEESGESECKAGDSFGGKSSKCKVKFT